MMQAQNMDKEYQSFLAELGEGVGGLPLDQREKVEPLKPIQLPPAPNPVAIASAPIQLGRHPFEF
jgi:hypothetical protein